MGWALVFRDVNRRFPAISLESVGLHAIFGVPISAAATFMQASGRTDCCGRVGVAFGLVAAVIGAAPGRVNWFSSADGRNQMAVRPDD
ncbi:unnamed protein product [Nippostrongylus brasiliensis]|uniref:MFS transporter n=1 Tax=Nippostrongylus brasiliensis TaxID=27835 RepID=A0A0N4YEB3_NIPBR|nr:unnamed protein product [Nippostrongylus brasiliensis]